MRRNRNYGGGRTVVYKQSRPRRSKKIWPWVLLGLGGLAFLFRKQLQTMVQGMKQKKQDSQ